MGNINAQSIINEVTAAAEKIKHAADLAGFGYAPEKITPAEIKKDVEFSALAKRPKCCPWGFEIEHYAETEIMNAEVYIGARYKVSQPPEIEVQHRWELLRMEFEADAELLQDVPDLCGPEFITIQTSARGHARIKNTAGNLLAFAAKVRSHAAAFGGGLVRTIKPRAAIVWPAKSISLFKQLIEDHDYSAALDLADSKLGALFCINKNGRALLQIAPVPVETMPGMVSVMSEGGDFSIIEPVSMRCIHGTCKRSRNAQIEAGQRHYDTATPESKARILSEAESMRVDQVACRAQWMAEHAIDDMQEIQARIDAQASQDVAQVVAGATAAAVIEQAQDAAALGALGSVDADTPAQAAQDVAQVVAGAQAMAAIEQASESSALQELTSDTTDTSIDTSTYQAACQADDVQELAIVGEELARQSGQQEPGASGGNMGNTSTTNTSSARLVASGTRGQSINSKSGVWSALFFVSDSGAPSMEFKQSGRVPCIVEFESGRDRMRALQQSAKWADEAARVCATPPASQAPEQTGAVPNSETPQDQTPGFERVKPFNCDPSAMLAKGIKPEQLVGMGVNYTGNMASPGGEGAITEVIDTRGERLGSLRLVVLLEDGRRVMGERHYFTEQLRPILQFNGKMHGAPYLAQLAATVATARAQASAAKEEAAQAHAAALVDLVAQYPQLQRSDSTYAGGRLAAVNMRTLLKMAFPGQKFSVTSDYNSARICWTDGPTDAEVDAVIGRFDIGASDPQSDYFYTVRTAWSDLFGGVQYLTTSRHTSDDLVSRALCELYPDSANRPAVQDYQKGTGVFDWFHDGDRVRRMMREQLAKMSTYQAPAAKTRARA